jgi:ABC-type cobalamin transport system permease subunit
MPSVFPASKVKVGNFGFIGLFVAGVLRFGGMPMNRYLVAVESLEGVV